MRSRVNSIVGYFLLFNLVNEYLYIKKNVGMIIVEYINRYSIENIGLLMIKNLDIHPMCVIDENAIIDLSLV
jgi:hypothetical protein